VIKVPFYCFFGHIIHHAIINYLSSHIHNPPMVRAEEERSKKRASFEGFGSRLKVAS